MFLLLDIGASKLRVGVSENLTDLNSHQIIQTPKLFEEGIDSIKQLAANLANGKLFKACAVGIREVLDPQKEKLVNNPSSSLIPDWVNKPLKNVLQHEFCPEVYLENDAAMAGLGEASFGAGHGYQVVAYITVSSGLGGARIVNNKIDSSLFGFEPGEQVINYLEELVYLGDYVSGADLQKKYLQKPELIDDPVIWKKVNKVLSIGLYNITVLWSPEVIVLGGGMAPKLSIEQILGNMLHLNRKFPTLPSVVKAKLSDLSGLYGCLEYLKQQY